MALPELDLSPVKFLLIDDNAFMRKILREILFVLNCHHLVMASDGQEAVDALATYDPDIIVTNWHMAPMDGISFTRYIRKLTDTKLEMTPVIMLTAHTEAGCVAQARDAGVNEFLAKPISAKVMYSRLVSLVIHPRPFVRSAVYTGPCRRRHSSMHYVGEEHRKFEIELP